MAPSPDPYEISTDPAKLDLDFICAQLATSYWAATRPRAVIAASLAASLNFGAYEQATGRQVGLARVVTDWATFGWVCDVIVAPAHRGHALGKRLMYAVVTEPRLRGTRMILGTKDAHGLYERYGFKRCEYLRRAADEPLPTGP